jgi:tetrahydrodipicolinate N-succinyltransferase
LANQQLNFGFIESGGVIQIGTGTNIGDGQTITGVDATLGNTYTDTNNNQQQSTAPVG